MGNAIFCFILSMAGMQPQFCMLPAPDDTTITTTGAPIVAPNNPPASTPSPFAPTTVVPAIGLTEWAFEESFDGDPSSPSQSLLPRTFEYVATHRSHPKEHFTKVFDTFPADHDDTCAGPDPAIVPLPQHTVQTRQDSSSAQPDDSFYICKNHIMSSMGKVEGYSVSAFWPRQELDLSNGKGVLEFDVNLNDGHTIRSWWEILITPRDQLKVGAGPVDSPISETYPDDRIVLSYRRNIRTIRIGNGALPPDGWTVDEQQYLEYDWAYWRDLHPEDPANGDRRIRRKMSIAFEDAKIVWGIETEDGSMDEWSVPVPSLPVNQGLVVFKTHAYNPTKDGNFDTYTFHWDNIRFSGPVAGLYKTYEASGVVYLQANGSREIGSTASVTIDIPDVLTLDENPTLFGQVHHPMRGQVLLSINGASNIEIMPYNYEEEDCWSVDWQSFRLPLDPSALVQGINTMEWTIGPRPECAPDPQEQWDGFSIKFLHVQVDV